MTRLFKRALKGWLNRTEDLLAFGGTIAAAPEEGAIG